jgi:hypothetical protein
MLLINEDVNLKTAYNEGVLMNKHSKQANRTLNLHKQTSCKLNNDLKRGKDPSTVKRKTIQIVINIYRNLKSLEKNTRPDNSFASRQHARYSANPRASHGKDNQTY